MWDLTILIKSFFPAFFSIFDPIARYSFYKQDGTTQLSEVVHKKDFKGNDLIFFFIHIPSYFQ